MNRRKNPKAKLPRRNPSSGRFVGGKKKNARRRGRYEYMVTGPRGGRYLTSTEAEAKRLTRRGGTFTRRLRR